MVHGKHLAWYLARDGIYYWFFTDTREMGVVTQVSLLFWGEGGHFHNWHPTGCVWLREMFGPLITVSKNVLNLIPTSN